ncbi:MAG: acyl carrier protein [Ekhidna sp.]|nr:acyl carrier protein [Ekhidna sp.]
MTRETVKTDLIDIIKPYLPEEVMNNEVSEENHLINDLMINSAHIVDIVLDIEDKFDIMIDDDVIGEMNTVNDSINVVLQKTA